MSGGNIQAWPPVTVNRICQTLIYRLAMHPLLIDPPIYHPETGHPIRIAKYRNFDGLELKNTKGITLSIFPYHFGGSDTGTSLTVESTNAGVTFKAHSLGGGIPDVLALDEATANIVVKLSAFGFSMDLNQDLNVAPAQVTTFEFNYVEWMLRQYAELVAHILRGRDMRRLPRFPDRRPLLANSFVTNIDYPTSRWEQKANLVLHSASLVWQTKYYVVREWENPPVYVPVEISDGNLVVGYLDTPSGIPDDIYYDTLLHRYLMKNGDEVERSALTDPATGVPYPHLDADLISLIDSSPRSLEDLSFYFKRVDAPER